MNMSEIGHLKIAITTNGLTQVDANFNGAKQVVFYDVASDSSRFVDLVQFKGSGAKKQPGAGKNGGCWMMDTEEESVGGVDHLSARVDALKGCAVLFTKGIGDPAAMRVKDLNVFPVKLENARDIDDVIVNLQKMMANDPPPLWIRRAMGHISQDSSCD
jgi:nitrogen fixation protein NifX